MYRISSIHVTRVVVSEAPPPPTSSTIRSNYVSGRTLVSYMDGVINAAPMRVVGTSATAHSARDPHKIHSRICIVDAECIEDIVDGAIVLLMQHMVDHRIGIDTCVYVF